MVIATVAAVAMILGAMSVGAAVWDYRKTPGLVGGLPASANPFTRQVRTARHTVEGVTPNPQVAGAETDVTTQEAAPVATTAVASNTDKGTDNAAAVTPPAAAPVKPAALPAPVQVPVAPVTQPVVNTVQNIVSPLTPEPVKQIINGVTGLLPTHIDTGLVNISLPKIGL